MNGRLAALLFAGLTGLAGLQIVDAAVVTNPPPMGAAGKPVIPPVPEDYFQRYGKILSPGTEPSHPLKLTMPFPDVGQIKIPSPEELAMRAKLEQLASLSDADIRKDLAAWPAFAEMTLGDEGAMLVRIQMFKDRRARIAQDRAHALGLLTLKPDQIQRFETEYWDKRMQMDAELTRQFAPLYKARENRLDEDLFREFSTPNMPVPPPKPPVKPTTAPALAATPKSGPTPSAAPMH